MTVICISFSEVKEEIKKKNMSFCRQRLMSWHLFSGFVLPRPNKHQSRAAYILVEEDVRSDISTLFQVTAWCSGSGCRRRRGRGSQDGQNLLSGSSPPFFSPKLLSSPPIRKNKKRILSFSVPSFFFILFFGEKKEKRKWEFRCCRGQVM